MNKKYSLICMSFDGDFVTEGRDFESIDAAWDRSNDMGSRWYFYPFHFVATEGGTIADTPDNLDFFKRKRIKTVQKTFASAAKQEDTQGYDADQFVFYLWDRHCAPEG